MAACHRAASFDSSMTRFNISLLLVALLITGCQSPMQRVLSKKPNWKKGAEALADKPQSDRSGLVREAFPNIENPLHVVIWNTIHRKANIGDGFGWIAQYNSGKFECFLVMLSAHEGHSRVSYFYDLAGPWVTDTSDFLGLARYNGDLGATLENARQLVSRLAVFQGYEAFVVDSALDIPHSRFQKENSHLTFTDLLVSKGITVSPPRFLPIEIADYGAYTECDIFVYIPCGGQLLRYQVRCQHGKITDAKRFVVCTQIGDWWGIM